MKRRNSYILGGATLACALGIGYVMQYGVPGQTTALNGPVEVTDIEMTSSAVVPRLPTDLELNGIFAEDDVTDANIQLEGERAPLPIPQLQGSAPRSVPQAAADCAITMAAETAAGAMVDVSLDAPCNGSERVTIHHNGLMFTEITQADGSLDVTVPAMAEDALFIAAFGNGDGATVSIKVSSVSLYDRVALQWRGNAGLQLHAREFNAEYFADGHVWADAKGNMAAAAQGQSGFLSSVGRSDVPEGLSAEIYSFPAGAASRDGVIALSIEAEITAANCDATIEAQTMEVRDGSGMRTRDLSVDMPGCDTVGDFLVLKNLVEDLTVASR